MLPVESQRVRKVTQSLSCSLLHRPLCLKSGGSWLPGGPAWIWEMMTLGRRTRPVWVCFGLLPGVAEITNVLTMPKKSHVLSSPGPLHMLLLLHFKGSLAFPSSPHCALCMRSMLSHVRLRHYGLQPHQALPSGILRQEYWWECYFACLPPNSHLFSILLALVPVTVPDKCSFRFLNLWFFFQLP